MFLSGIITFPVTILSGAAVSAEVPMGAMTLSGILMPAAWTAAGLAFDVTLDDGVSWHPLFDDAGNECVVTNPAAGNFIVLKALPSYVMRGINALRVLSGTHSVAVNQGADRIITLIGRNEGI